MRQKVSQTFLPHSAPFVPSRKNRLSKRRLHRKPVLRLGTTIRNAFFYVLLAFIVTSVSICVLLRWLPPPTSAFMLYRHIEDVGNNRFYHPIDYRWVSSTNISPSAYRSVIASEDQRFFEHFGFDLKSIQSSIDAYIDGGRLRGASTISQQVAKNLFLNPAKNFVRKGFEIWFTLLIEGLWSKERILTVYLNIAEFGDHLFGIEAASQRYFGVSARQLNRSQAALLAATLPNPIRLKATRPSGYLRERQQWILRQMRYVDFPRPH